MINYYLRIDNEQEFLILWDFFSGSILWDLYIGESREFHEEIFLHKYILKHLTLLIDESHEILCNG